MIKYDEKNKISLFKSMESYKIPSGVLCKIHLEGVIITEDGFATVGRRSNGFVEVFETIDLSSYPSCSDFKGGTTLVKQGDVVIIMKYVGRPLKVVYDPRWFMYDVYEVLVKGNLRQMFRQNLIKIQ